MNQTAGGSSGTPIQWKRLITVFALFVVAEALLVRFVIATADNWALHYIFIPAAAVSIVLARMPGLREWVQPGSRTVLVPMPAVPSPPAPQPEVIAAPPRPPRVCVMGPEHADLYTRVDPFTRTRFAIGESFVLCGGRCGRAYKLVTCEHLQYRCPADGAPLR